MQSQSSLFESSRESLPIADGKLDYYPEWLGAQDADQSFVSLKKTVQWQQSVINMYGKSIVIPRLNAWYGERGRDYGYSGHRFNVLPWLPLLKALKCRIEAETGFKFNSVLVNCYRDGRDSVAWHSDDERELKKNPAIASLSLGAERFFQLRHRYQKQAKVTQISLAHGSLLLMSGPLQHYWQHQLPKVAAKTGERINLTYRYIHK